MAQNLVPNPNFALYNSCPTGVGQLNKCAYWYNASTATPDYFNACHDTLVGSWHSVGVPNNGCGSQVSASNAYIGVGTLTQSAANFREYAGTKIPVLVPGAAYRVLLRISLADELFVGTEAPSVLFTKDVDTFNATNSVLPFTPQVEFSNAGHITEKINWVTVTDTFIADSAYTHMIIGNFRNDAMTTSTLLPSGPTVSACLFYIDSVSVEKVADPVAAVPVNSNASVQLLPNPVTQNAVLTIDNVSAGKHVLTVANMQGQAVRTMDINAGSTVIPCGGLAPGIYYCRLYVDGRVAWHERITVVPQ